MKILIRLINHPVVILLLLVIAVIINLILLGRACGVSKAEWAAWVGSIGTVGTLIGTIVIAQTETRRRERGELLLARLHAASMVLRLIFIKNIARKVAGFLDEAATSDDALAKIKTAQKYYSQIEMWSTNELTVLIPFGKSVALNLAKAADQHYALGVVFDNELRNATKFSNESRQKTARNFHKNLLTTIEHIEAALAVCRAESASLGE